MPVNHDCTLCPLHSVARSVCVWGEARGGNPSRIMILGQSPSYDDDKAGRPLVGSAAKLLNDALVEAGLESYYVTTVAKCFSNNIKITKSHINACSDYLDEEIATIKPTHILALGNEAVQRLLGKGKVTEIAGKEQWSEKYQCWVVAAYHPAFILKQMGRLGSWKADIYRFVHLVKGELLDKPPVDVHMVGLDLSMDDFRSMFIQRCKNEEPFAYDFETTISPWWSFDWSAYSVSFAWSGTEAFTLPIDHPESLIGDRARSFLKEIQPYAMSPRIPKIGHNGIIFDANVWQRLTGYPIYVNYDTMIEAALIDENRPKRLKWLGGAILGWPDWDIDAKIYHPLNMLSYYNGCDSAATFLLHYIQMEQMDDDIKKYYVTLEMPKARAVQAMMWRGVHVDRKQLAIAKELTIAARDDAARRIPVENPNSSQQIAHWLYDVEKLPVPHETPGGAPSTDRETIISLAERFPQARVIKDYRTHEKRLNTWIEPCEERIAKSLDARDHFDYRVPGPETGRLASNYHTTPNEPLIRNIYSAPAGWSLISSDFSQLEARLAAWEACGRPSNWDNVPPNSMLKAFLDGRDIYKELAAGLLRKPVEEITPDERQKMGKIPTLAMIYRISPEGFRDYAWKGFELRYSVAEARHIWTLFYTMWPEIKAWHEREDRILRSRGWARTIIGRRRRLPEAMGSGYSALEAVNSGINAPIQGLASDINCTAHIILEKKLDLTAAFVVGSQHDSLQIQSKNYYLEEAVRLVRHSMEYAPRALLSLGLDLPVGLLKVEVSVGAWGSK